MYTPPEFLKVKINVRDSFAAYTFAGDCQKIGDPFEVSFFARGDTAQCTVLGHQSCAEMGITASNPIGG